MRDEVLAHGVQVEPVELGREDLGVAEEGHEGPEAPLRVAIGLATRPCDDAARTARLDRARDLLGNEVFEQHWSEATKQELAEMIEYVSRARGERKRPSAGWDSLTPTERRVVGLAAAGLTNPEIAERMFIARGTVKVHLGHVFAKLGVATRAELAAQATKRELDET